MPSHEPVRDIGKLILISLEMKGEIVMLFEKVFFLKLVFELEITSTQRKPTTILSVEISIG